jgi:hypothetical protein
MRSRERWTAWAVLALVVLTAAAFLVILLSGLVLKFTIACTSGACSGSLSYGRPPVGEVLDGRLGGRRALAWMTGVVCFLASLRTVFASQ